MWTLNLGRETPFPLIVRTLDLCLDALIVSTKFVELLHLWAGIDLCHFYAFPIPEHYVQLCNTIYQPHPVLCGVCRLQTRKIKWWNAMDSCKYISLQEKRSVSANFSLLAASLYICCETRKICIVPQRRHIYCVSRECMLRRYRQRHTINHALPSFSNGCFAHVHFIWLFGFTMDLQWASSNYKYSIRSVLSELKFAWHD